MPIGYCKVLADNIYKKRTDCYSGCDLCYNSPNETEQHNILKWRICFRTAIPLMKCLIVIFFKLIYIRKNNENIYHKKS